MSREIRARGRGAWAVFVALVVFSICSGRTLAVPQAPSGRGARAPARGASVTIDASVTLLQPADTPGPIQLAVSDLAADLAKVFGRRPRVVAREQDAGPVTIVVGERAKLPDAWRPRETEAPESFSIAAAAPQGPGARQVIVLSGADVRGTIYAALLM